MALAHLRKIELLRKLPARELKRILSISQTRSFAPESPIFGKSEVADHMFVVISGRVKIYAESNARKRKVFAYLGPGDFFGEMAVLDDRERSASARAVEESRLLIIHKKDLKRLLISDSNLCYYLLQTVTQRLRRANEEIESLLFKNILGRVSKVLYELAGPAGSRRGRDVPLKRRYTHQELADLVGTTREPLSRALAMLRRAELVDLREGNIVILDAKKLASLSQDAVQTD